MFLTRPSIAARFIYGRSEREKAYISPGERELGVCSRFHRTGLPYTASDSSRVSVGYYVQLARDADRRECTRSACGWSLS